MPFRDTFTIKVRKRLNEKRVAQCRVAAAAKGGQRGADGGVCNWLACLVSE